MDSPYYGVRNVRNVSPLSQRNVLGRMAIGSSIDMVRQPLQSQVDETESRNLNKPQACSVT